jgi:hypothetical protein
MANGPPISVNRSAKHKITSSKKFNWIDDDYNNVTLSPLYDIFDNQLQYSMPSCAPSMSLEPLPYYVGSSPAPVYPVLNIQDDARKRQRRQTAGNLVVNTFFNRGNNADSVPSSATAAPAGGVAAAKIPKKKQSTAQPRPQIAVPPNGIGPIRDPNVNDVLSGRGGRINAHIGNVQFREIVAERKKDYLAKDTKKLEKAHIAADIVYFVRRMDPPGRFLKEDINGAWWDIGDQKAIKKVGQALREDAPDIRDPDDPLNDIMEQQQKDGALLNSTGKPPARPLISSAESTPTQTNRALTAAADACNSVMPIPPVTTSGSGSGSCGGKAATAVSARGGKTPHISSSSSVRSGHGGSGSYQQQQQQQQQPLSFQIDIRPPESYQTVVPQQPHRRVGQITAPFHGNRVFRGGMAQRMGAAVSGAAAAVMKQQQQHPQQSLHEFEVPAARHSSLSQDEAFGRTFHAPPDTQHGDSSLISGFSGGASAVSGMSGISALTDPMSSVSNSDVFHHGPSRAARQAQLDRIRQNWASPSAVATSDNTPTIQLLSASNGIGSSLNNSSAMRMHMDHGDDNMSWTHSLNGGGIGHNRDDSARDDSVLFGGTESQLSAGSGGNHSLGALSVTSGSGLMGSSKHSRLSGMHRGSGAPRNNGGGLAAYYPGDVSVTSGMSIASAGVDSLPSMSELSENLVALDLAHNAGGSILEEI